LRHCHHCMTKRVNAQITVMMAAAKTKRVQTLKFKNGDWLFIATLPLSMRSGYIGL